MAFSIEHVAIRCRNLETSIDYFRQMFGAEVILRREPDKSRRIVFLRIGDSMLELMEMGPASEPAEPMKHFGFHHIGIKTDDFDATYKNLQAKGAEFLGEPFEPTPGIRLVFLKEPNGAAIELTYRDPKVLGDAIARGSVNW